MAQACSLRQCPKPPAWLADQITLRGQPERLPGLSQATGSRHYGAPAHEEAAPGRDEYIAIGILMERLRIDYERAASALRLQAQAEDKGVTELASTMVDAANRLNSIRR